MTEGSPVHVGVYEGYTQWARTYETIWNTLIATEEIYSLDLLDSLTGTTALDVGAGTGRYALKLARNRWDATALDANPAMLAVAINAAKKAGLPVRFLEGQIQDGLPAGSGVFDLVVRGLTLCHVAGLQGAMAEIHRVLGLGGHLLVTDVHPDFISAGMPTQFVDGGVTYHLPNEPHIRDDYVEAVQDTGLAVSSVVEVSTKDIPGGFETEFMRDRFPDTNFSLILLAGKPA